MIFPSPFVFQAKLLSNPFIILSNIYIYNIEPLSANELLECVWPFLWLAHKELSHPSILQKYSSKVVHIKRFCDRLSDVFAWISCQLFWKDFLEYEKILFFQARIEVSGYFRDKRVLQESDFSYCHWAEPYFLWRYSILSP